MSRQYLELDLSTCTNEAERGQLLKLGSALVGSKLVDHRVLGGVYGLFLVSLITGNVRVCRGFDKITLPLDQIKLKPNGDHCGWLRVLDPVGATFTLQYVGNPHHQLVSNGTTVWSSSLKWATLDPEWLQSIPGARVYEEGEG